MVAHKLNARGLKGLPVTIIAYATVAGLFLAYTWFGLTIIIFVAMMLALRGIVEAGFWLAPKVQAWLEAEGNRESRLPHTEEESQPEQEPSGTEVHWEDPSMIDEDVVYSGKGWGRVPDCMG